MYIKQTWFIYRSGSAVVTSKLLFNSSSPVPSEALVLSPINTLLNSRESQLNESVKVVNVTYESKCHSIRLYSFWMGIRQTIMNGKLWPKNLLKFSFHTEISETSYAVVFTFNLVNISMPEDPERRNNTYLQVEDVVNNAVKIWKWTIWKY